MISLSHFKILFQMLFLVRVTSTEYNWVTLAEGRHQKAMSYARSGVQVDGFLSLAFCRLDVAQAQGDATQLHMKVNVFWIDSYGLSILLGRLLVLGVRLMQQP